MKIINEKGLRNIESRKCIVYGRSLTHSKALTLAQRHNETNQLQRATSFSEIAGTCRRPIFSEFVPDMNDNPDGTGQMPVVPRYNSQPYREFKKKCLSILVNTQNVSDSICV